MKLLQLNVSSCCEVTNTYCMDLMGTCLRGSCKFKLSDPREIQSSSIVIIRSYTRSLLLPLQQGCGAGARSCFGWLESEPKTFRWWNRNPKFGFRFHTHSLWGKRFVQIFHGFLVFHGPNHSGAGTRAKKLYALN